MTRALLLAALLVCAPICAAQIYKWTDSSGKVHYSDRSPEETTRREELKIEVQSFGGTPVIRNADVVRRKQDASRPSAGGSLTMYATSWCGYCRQARAYFAKNGISYREVDVEASSENQRVFRTFGGRGVPLFVYGERTMRGFSPEAMEQFLALTPAPSR